MKGTVNSIAEVRIENVDVDIFKVKTENLSRFEHHFFSLI